MFISFIVSFSFQFSFILIQPLISQMTSFYLVSVVQVLGGLEAEHPIMICLCGRTPSRHVFSSFSFSEETAAELRGLGNHTLKSHSIIKSSSISSSVVYLPRMNDNDDDEEKLKLRPLAGRRGRDSLQLTNLWSRSSSVCEWKPWPADLRPGAGTVYSWSDSLVSLTFDLWLRRRSIKKPHPPGETALCPWKSRKWLLVWSRDQSGPNTWFKHLVQTPGSPGRRHR